LSERLVFSHTVEGLYQRALGGRIDSACLGRLRDIGLDLGRPLLPAYPFDVWMKSIAIVAENVFPGVQPVEARRRLGEELIRGYRETYLGRATLAVAKVFGPKRTLRRSAHNFRSGNNYTEVKIEETGPTSMEMWMNLVGPYPEFTQGIISAGMEVAGAHDVKVEISHHDGEAATYRIAWSET
jgi:uncharacterized protein (TIGR02265 family)